MFEIQNPEPTAYEETRLHNRLYRHYRRLLALPSGVYGNRAIRELFGFNGQFEAIRMKEVLADLEKEGALEVTWATDERGTMQYRLTLNPLTEVDGINAMNDKDIFAGDEVLMKLFTELQTKVLKAKKKPTIADRTLAKRLLKDIDLELALKLVRAYWGLRAERRNGSMFNDFYYQYPTLLNDVVDELEVERGQAARDARRKAPKLSRREWLIREIAIRKKKGRPLFGLDTELAALNGEE